LSRENGSNNNEKAKFFEKIKFKFKLVDDKKLVKGKNNTFKVKWLE
jgi:hypothetical protein